MDVLTPSQRSQCMTANRSRDTRPEVELRKVCWALGMRYRLKYRLEGRPDFVFPNAKLAVFVDGCFWHGCSEHYQAPATRGDFWRQKLIKNIARDSLVSARLQSSGWSVIRVWEHDLKDYASRHAEALRIQRVLNSLVASHSEMISKAVRVRRRSRLKAN